MKPSIEQIKQVAETFKGEYGIVAIRTQEESFDLGCINHVSHVWDAGEVVISDPVCVYIF